MKKENVREVRFSYTIVQWKMHGIFRRLIDTYPTISAFSKIAMTVKHILNSHIRKLQHTHIVLAENARTKVIMNTHTKPLHDEETFL
jgi:hypothetical protein